MASISPAGGRSTSTSVAPASRSASQVRSNPAAAPGPRGTAPFSAAEMPTRTPSSAGPPPVHSGAGGSGSAVVAGSPLWGPLMAASIGHRSSTRPATTPGVSSEGARAAPPARLMRPNVGLTPATPQNAAGIRTEPPVSLATAAGTIPAATAAADPPLEPPGTLSRFHGLRGLGRVACWEVIPQPNSCERVTPTITAPAARSRRTSSASTSGTRPARASEPWSPMAPATSNSSLTATGTPCSGPRDSPRRNSAVRSAASAVARSTVTSANAPSKPSRRSIRSSAAAITSLGSVSPAAYSASRRAIESPEASMSRLALFSPTGSRESRPPPGSRPAPATAPLPGPRGSPCPPRRSIPPNAPC